MYEQTCGFPCPPSLILANLYMEHFKIKALNTFALKLDLWVRYDDDTNFKWPHSKETLKNFVHHLNGLSKNIQFTMELEDNNSIPFLDVLIYIKFDGFLGH
jgi:hypothetical protein